MRLKMTPEQLMKDLLNSDSFDDLVAYRLKISLESATDTLTKLYNMRSWSANNYDDYVDTLRYARALVVVLSWFDINDWYDVDVELNKFSLRLDQDFDPPKLPEGRHPLSDDWFREKAAAFSFDEYGYYGENNAPLQDIRPMTEEERQRSKERDQNNASN